ncbi:MAG: hypothetical protein GX575_07560 [Candidatus Anammoximicrobium sp.]|nr:hypothetical protein [Candidatus Anammoximicrobium sp.]
MRSVRRIRFADFPYACVLVISPHPDDSVLGCGGLVFKLTSHRETRSRVKITVFTMTPGYHGVDSDFFREGAAVGRENLLRWPGVPHTELEDDCRLMAALRDCLGDDFDVYSKPGESDQKKLENIIRTAIRFGECCREVETLGLPPASALRFLALPRLYSKCICPGELVRLRHELSQAADEGECNLLLVPHPDDPQPAHQAVTEATLRALDPALKWHIWYYPSPWYRMPPCAIDAIVPLNDEELYRKRAAAETHRSQTIRTPYGKYVMSGASLNADILPELLLGFGGRCTNAFGKYCEVFQMRLPSFYTCSQGQSDLVICADDILPIDAELAGD